MKIPKSFELFGQTIKVVWDNDGLNKAELYAQAVLRDNVIKLSDECIIDGKCQKLQKDKINANFLHEVIHFILSLMEDEKGDDEQFVTRIAELLYQFQKTAKY